MKPHRPSRSSRRAAFALSPLGLAGFFVGSTLAQPAQAIEHPHSDALSLPRLKLSYSLGHASEGNRAPDAVVRPVTLPLISDAATAPMPDQIEGVLPGLLRTAASRSLLLAQSTGGATVTVSPRKDEEPAPRGPQPAARASTSPPPEDENRPKEKRYGLAPIRWGGQIAYTRSRFRTDDSAWSETNAYELGAQASSYILAPWIALINGGATVVMTDSSNTGSTGQVSGGSENVGVSGTLGANIFPVSRFPFSLELRATDSRTDATSFDRNRKTYRLSARQDYRPARGEWSTFATYDFDRIQESELGDDTVHRLAGGYRVQGDNQTLDANASLSHNQRDDGFNSDIALLTANHYRRLRPDLTVTSNASYLYDKRTPSGSATASDLQTLQAYSAANWNPLNSPWTANASVRLALSETNGGPLNESLSLAGGSTYRYSRNLSFGASATANMFTVADGDHETITTEFLTATYNGDPLNFGRVSYNWGLTSSASNVSGANNSSQSLSGSVFHSLNTYWQPSAISTISASGNQTLSHIKGFGDEALSTSTLNHSASLNYQIMPSAASQAMMGLSLTDSRSFGDQVSRFQMASFQFNGNWITSQYAALSGNLTIQRTWRKQDDFANETTVSQDTVDDPFAIDTTQTSDTNTSTNGSVTYFHSRAFGVRDLRYSLRFIASTATTNEREFGDPDGNRDRVSRILEQDLDYRVGRLDTQLKMRVAEVDGRKNALLLFRVSRSFGNF
ncbi:MAG: hypothetical protein KDG55_01445 [Rhodocyclaceae bacterium]|nr:hypothetical protein [Rhodocyclaceae bacterium]